jgi:hypothetical protein
MCNSGVWAMPGHKDSLIRESEDLLPDTREQQFVITIHQVSTPNGLTEYGVSTNGCL